ncbi:hypothetical protein MKX07_001366 [Trichoderma sp. CBMAI-0711]|nr:hypothetical protein MKX07_001366 [Trichoderma sp. CBMAI-0711]
MVNIFGEHDAVQGLPWVDSRVLAALPDVAEVLEAGYHTESAWAKGYRLRVRQTDGNVETYFMKVSTNHHGKLALMGEFESTSTIHAITPDFCPKPIACGTFNTDANSHFYVCKFYDFVEGVPEPNSFCQKLARLHSSHPSPEGKFGFHCTTYNGDLPQDNNWCESWEVFYANGLRHVLIIREQRAGRNPELDELLPALFGKVIPRLLRPLESEGRTIKPSLVHGDLWCGNAGIIDSDTAEGIVFDPTAFWAHNEYDFGDWRPGRNKFTRRYFQAYHSLVPKSEPEEDYDGRAVTPYIPRGLICTLRHCSRNKNDIFTYEIRRLVEAYPEGYTVITGDASLEETRSEMGSDMGPDLTLVNSQDEDIPAQTKEHIVPDKEALLSSIGFAEVVNWQADDEEDGEGNVPRQSFVAELLV